MEENGAMEIVQGTLTQLSSDVTALIPAALGIAVLVFGAIFLWNTAKRIVS